MVAGKIQLHSLFLLPFILPQTQFKQSSSSYLGTRALPDHILAPPHSLPCKVTGKCGSVTVRMVPAPRGAGIVAARVPKKVLQFAGIDDVFTSSRGSTKTLGNFVKATFDCLQKTYGFLTPDFWRETHFSKSPFQEYTDLLGKQTKTITYTDVEKAEA